MKRHVRQLHKSQKDYYTKNGQIVDVFEIQVPESDNLILSWAQHIRKQYCSNDELTQLSQGTGKTKGKFLQDIIFPDGGEKPGPSIRAGDFAEILLSDYLEFTQSYWVPRNRFKNKAIKNESVKGADVVAFKFQINGQINANDTLAIFESKAQL